MLKIPSHKSKSSDDESVVNKLTRLSAGWNALFMVILIVTALIVIVPVALVVIISFTSQTSINSKGYSFFPSAWSLAGYAAVFKMGTALWQSYLVTIFYSVAGTVISLVFMTTFAYVLAQKQFFLRKALTWYLFFTMLFSGGLVPAYILNVRYLQLNNTIWIFLLFNTVNAFYVIILRTFIKTTVPDSVFEAAKIDGAGHFTIFARILLPLFKAPIATIALFSMVARWNEWFTGMLYIDASGSTAKLVPLQTVLIQLQNKMDFLTNNSLFASTPDGINMAKNLPTDSMRMACTIIVILPIVFAYPFFQRFFVSGLTIGSIKE